MFYDRLDAAILAAVRGRLFSGCAGLALLLLIGLMLLSAGFAQASENESEHAAHLALQLSDNAFGMLNSISAKNNMSSLAAPVASFAADAQTLSQMLTSGDRTGVASQMATLLADRAAVDKAIKGSGESEMWSSITHELEALAKAMPPSVAGPSIARASTSSGTPTESGASATESSPAKPVASEGAAPLERIGPMPSESSIGEPPKAVIESSSNEGGVMRIKGYLEGTALTGGGIYQNGQLLKRIKIATIQGEQRLDFDIGLGSPEPGTSIRVYDSQGRSAEAFASSPEGGIVNSGPRNSGANEEGVEVDGSRPAEAPEENAAAGTAEIPSHGSTRPSPSKRHTLESHLGDVQIDVVTVRQIAVEPPMYEVLGVIQGRDVTHAGIYIDGRLAAEIATSSSAATNNIDKRFVMDGGSASIRAFGVGSHYAEQPIDLSTAIAATTPSAMFNSSTIDPPVPGGTSMIIGAPANAEPGTMSIQIQSVTSLSPSQTVVTGIINGRNVRTAGLYQNGMLDQAIPIGGANGAAGFLGSVLSHFGTQTVPFTAYYNPANGPAVIRVTDNTGAYTEQAIGVGGINAYMAAPSAGSGIGNRPPEGAW